MKADLNSLLIDLNILVSSTQEDFKSKFWNNYEKYLEQYNSILKALKKVGLFQNITEIAPVPDMQKAYMGVGFSNPEKAKLREIANSSQRLQHQLKLLVQEKQREEPNALERIERICSRFHIVALQLQKRRDNRKTLKVEDEYDVQDLLHALLKVDFDDIRPEEWTPSYAGKSSRMDFLLKKKEVVVEAKMTRNGLGAKQIGAQLIEDIARYSQSKNCKILVCFVYDPKHVIRNPRGIENDLESLGKDFKVIVLIRPTGE